MENILMWIAIVIISLTIIGYVVYKIYEISKMTPEQRKQKIVTYLKGGVCAAERSIGAGNGPIKLEQVEEYFHKNANWFLKALLFITGTDTLKELIEVALSEIKEDFGGE